MKISEIDDSVKLVDFENFFDVYENQNDIRKPYTFNINSTIYFDGVPQKEYKLTHDMFWTTLSHEIYETTRLWWILMKVNNVDKNHIFDSVKSGSTVKYIDKDTVRRILLDIKD